MAARGSEHFDRGQVPAFEAEHGAGAGEGGFPRDFEVDAFEAVWFALGGHGQSIVCPHQKEYGGPIEPEIRAPHSPDASFAMGAQPSHPGGPED